MYMNIYLVNREGIDKRLKRRLEKVGERRINAFEELQRSFMMIGTG